MDQHLNRHEPEIGRSPLREAFRGPAAFKVMLPTLVAAAMPLGVVWSIACLTALVFLGGPMQMDMLDIYLVIAVALAVSTPVHVLAGWLSDKVGTRPVIVAGVLLSLIAVYPAFVGLERLANPGLVQFQAATPITVTARDCHTRIFVTPASRLSACDRAKAFLTHAGLHFASEAADPSQPDVVTTFAGYDIAGFDPAVYKTELQSLGYPKPARLALLTKLGIAAVLAVLLAAAGVVTGPLSAYLIRRLAPPARTILHGRCHCGCVKAEFGLGKPVDEVAVRACQCRFCRMHGAATATDPTGVLTLNSARPLTRYRFASGATEVLLCPGCGTYVGGVIEADGRKLATVNVRGLAMAPLCGREPEPAEYGAEDAAGQTGAARAHVDARGDRGALKVWTSALPWPHQELIPGAPIMSRPPLPPFDLDTAAQKARMAEDAWNSRDPEKVSLAYTVDSRWRNRTEFPQGRAEIVAFLARKWAKELEYRLIKEVWGFRGNRIGVRFAYEWHDEAGQWFRSYGNEFWEFDAEGLMAQRHASINDMPIDESDRLFHWPLGRRPDDHPGLSALGL